MTYTLGFVNFRSISRLSIAALGAVAMLGGCAEGGEDDPFDPGFVVDSGASWLADAGASPFVPSTPPGSSSAPITTTPTTPVTVYDAGIGVYDAGSSSPVRQDAGSSSSASGPDAGNPLDGIISGLGGLLGSGDGGAPKPAGDGGAAKDNPICKEAICFDVFDCYIFHTDKLDCGFTACDGFVCK